MSGLSSDDFKGQTSALANQEDLDDEPTLVELVVALWPQLKLACLAAVLVGSAAVAASFAVDETFTSKTVVLPPQQQRSAAAAALTQLGALSGLAGAAAGIKSPADQYASLLQSTIVADRLIEQFGLMAAYEARYRYEARRELAENTRIAVGKKDGLIAIEVDDNDPKRAADLANSYVEELRRLTSELALTEAQQRRIFFERQLVQTRSRLEQAQQALQASGFNPGALQTDARSAAEAYARLRAELTAAEVRARVVRERLVDTTPEVSQALATVEALRSQLAKLESPPSRQTDADYIGRFREFKYQEALFELFSKQFELARLDESNDGALIQVIDRAAPAERKSRPKRAMLGLVVTGLTFLVITVGLVFRSQWRLAAARPGVSDRLERLRAAIQLRPKA